MSQPNGAQAPPSPFAALGLGALWQPAPGTVAFAKLGPDAYVMIVETVAGRVGVALDAGGLRAVIANAQSLSSGLVLPT